MLFSQYRQLGGEEVSTNTEAELLREAGDEVEVVPVSSPLTRTVAERLADFQPDVVHVQNFFPHLHANHYRSIARRAIPIVQAARNYRLTCIAGTQWRGGRLCNDCSFRNPMPGVVHGCYRQSRTMSAAAAGIMTSHRVMGSWTRHVSLFLAVSEHVKASIADSVGGARVIVKPNTVITDVIGTGTADEVVYVGRLSPEKGIVDLARTWSNHPELPLLRIVGEGPARPVIEILVEAAANITLEGGVPHRRALEIMANARASVVPWKWNEPFGRTIVESLAVGTPVIASAAAAKVFGNPGPAVLSASFDDADDLRRALLTIGHGDDTIRAAATRHFNEAFSPSSNLRLLNDAYNRATSG